jgi:hypothetical protein
MSIHTMTIPAASLLQRTSAFMRPGEGQWCIDVPQLDHGRYAGPVFQPTAGITQNRIFIRNRVVNAAKPGSPPRGAPR